MLPHVAVYERDLAREASSGPTADFSLPDYLRTLTTSKEILHSPVVSEVVVAGYDRDSPSVRATFAALTAWKTFAQKHP